MLGSGVVASLVAFLVRLASLSENRPTRHSYRLAPQSFRLVLDTEIAAPAWKIGPKRGDSRLDLPHEPSQPRCGERPVKR